MRFAVCNEMFEQMPFDEVCRVAAEIGYEGVEIAPFTLAEQVGQLDAAARRAIADTAARHGLTIAGTHWLLVKPAGLHMSTPDDTVRRRTRDYFIELVHFCADIGGEILVCGSPKQRTVIDTPEASRERLIEVFRDVAAVAGERGVTFCLEPLAPSETEFINTAADGVAIIEAVDHPNFRLILDCKAMSGSESAPLDQVIRNNREHLRHFHANDPNLLGPGMGELDHRPLGAALRDIGYAGWVSVEVFDFALGGLELARRSFATLRECYA